MSLPDDVKPLTWAAEQLGIGLSTAYRLVGTGQIPGAFKVGGQWRVSVPRFLADVHGSDAAVSARRNNADECCQDCGPGQSGCAAVLTAERQPAGLVRSVDGGSVSVRPSAEASSRSRCSRACA